MSIVIQIILRYLGKLDLGINIDVDQYQAYLEQAIEYTLKQKGITAKDKESNFYSCRCVQFIEKEKSNKKRNRVKAKKEE